jgi:hypothetical protein
MNSIDQEILKDLSNIIFILDYFMELLMVSFLKVENLGILKHM